ncbi:hypothetical protein [Streptomyces sp. S1D4-14]|uniref:hypothetical protein n=1 Tax=Streptomyces sp. S1D4-14 TaxID=2594461 RepID=UPI001164EB06|nr:hypothetical protein [Streptomyces sp. S1D4-14]QDN64445.1 hypothetical protein FNV66_01025 [Streptomyces sp. S1D4-14]
MADFLTIDRNKLENVARKGSAVLVQRLTLRTAAIAATIAPGHMGQTVRPIFKGSLANPVGIVMVDHPAASYVLNGTRPHEIPAKPGGVLRFKWKGKVVYFKSVQHPGTKPNNFLWKAMLAAKFNG